MPKMSAAVQDKITGETAVITSEYLNKAAFKKDLIMNGYSVIGRIAVDGEDTVKKRRYDKGCRA